MKKTLWYSLIFFAGLCSMQLTVADENGAKNSQDQQQKKEAEDDKQASVITEEKQSFDHVKIDSVKIKQTDKEPERFVLDEIAVVVYGKMRVAIVCKSDLQRLSVDGRKRTLMDLVLDELIFQDALFYKIPIDETVVDKYIANLRSERGLTLDQIKEAFTQVGYTYEEGREQLKMIYAKNAMIDHKITSRLIVTREEAEKYYEANPVVEEAEFTLKMALISFDNEKKTEVQKESLEQDLKAGRIAQFIWGQPFTLKESEISKNVDFISRMNPGDLSPPIQIRNGFEVYQLVEKKDAYQVPLEKVYMQVVQKLKEPKLTELFETYKKELLDSASIVYHDEQLKEQVKQS